jgi:30S ribosomal protein S31
MGKGDRRSKRGKIFRGTFGKTRPRNSKKSKVAAAPAKEGTS